MKRREVTATFTRSYGLIPVREADEPKACPVCESDDKLDDDSVILGTVEFIEGTALTAGDGSEYTGTTDMDWDSQTTMTAEVDDQAAPVLQCEIGHLFVHLGVCP